MNKAILLACCLLILPLVGTAPTGPAFRTPSLVPSPLEPELRRGAALFASARYSKAAAIFNATADKARNSNDPDMALRASANAGACHFALHQYDAALAAFLDARKLAGRLHDSSKAAALDINIASVYSELGEVDSAARWIEASAGRLRGDERRRFLPKLRIQMGVIRADQARLQDAERLFREGIQLAADAGDTETYALGCNRMGEAYLLAGDLARAEPALVEAFRVRKLHHLPVDTSYHRLGRLRLAQGDFVSASNLLDRAVELAGGARNLMPAWDIYYSRGLVRLRQGRIADALSDLRIAARLARDWRRSVPAAQAARISAQSKLEQAYSAWIDAATTLYARQRDPGLAAEAFSAAEANRAWGVPAENERAEASELAARVQAAVDKDTALFSFHIGEAGSYVWAIDRGGITLHPLPARAELEPQVKAVTRAIETGAPGAAESSAHLFATLFGAPPRRVLGRRRWLLSLDQNLFDLPVAALVEYRAAHPVYVAERHVVQVIPGVLSWLDAAHQQKARRTPPEPAFLGIGDAIYNTADPRGHFRARPVARLASPFRLFAAEPRDAMPALPRLAGSGQELADCARGWRGDSVLLEGAGASRARVVAELRRNPAVIHFATHFVAAAERPSYLVFDGPGMRRATEAEEMIALSLNGAGEPELVTAAEIARWRLSADLVSLSGCHSASGTTLPGIGLLGLTRACLTAGARAVAGSLWDVPDSSGPLFAALYRHLTGPAADAALALNSAQREMIRSGDWRAQPRYWGAYFVVAHD